MCHVCPQALAQYLVNLNVWTHNVLTIVARRRAQRTRSRCDVRAAGAGFLSGFLGLPPPSKGLCPSSTQS